MTGVGEAVPPDADQRDADPYRSLYFVAGSPAETAYLDEIRVRFGAERAERVRRDREQWSLSRPLTGGERDRLRTALGPVLRDIAASGVILPLIQEESNEAEDEEFVSVMAWGADGSGTGLLIPAEPTAAEGVAQAADRLQEWEIEELASAGRSTAWPECPAHRDSHPLEPVADGDRAVWRCPRTGDEVSAIGALPGRHGPG
jgi:hypothetical protein